MIDTRLVWCRSPGLPALGAVSLPVGRSCVRVQQLAEVAFEFTSLLETS